MKKLIIEIKQIAGALWLPASFITINGMQLLENIFKLKLEIFEPAVLGDPMKWRHFDGAEWSARKLSYNVCYRILCICEYYGLSFNDIEDLLAAEMFKYDTPRGWIKDAINRVNDIRTHIEIGREWGNHVLYTLDKLIGSGTEHLSANVKADYCYLIKGIGLLYAIDDACYLAPETVKIIIPRYYNKKIATGLLGARSKYTRTKTLQLKTNLKFKKNWKSIDWRKIN